MLRHYGAGVQVLAATLCLLGQNCAAQNRMIASVARAAVLLDHFLGCLEKFLVCYVIAFSKKRTVALKEALGYRPHSCPLLQVDPCLPADQQQAAKDRMVKMFHAQTLDAGRVTQAVATAYHDVTRRKILC